MDHSTSVFNLPDLGEGLTGAEILEWLVCEGDDVALDQPIVTVETAKTALDLPAPAAGRVHRLHARPTQVVAVGAPLITLTGVDQHDPVPHLVGHAPPPPVVDLEVAARRLPPRGTTDRVVVTPAVRRLARELNVDLHSIRVRDGVRAITREDVLAACTHGGNRAQI